MAINPKAAADDSIERLDYDEADLRSLYQNAGALTLANQPVIDTTKSGLGPEALQNAAARVAHTLDESKGEFGSSHPTSALTSAQIVKLCEEAQQSGEIIAGEAAIM